LTLIETRRQDLAYRLSRPKHAVQTYSIINTV
jgi:hypothetical protein